MGWLGIDIGGANIKLADGRGFADAQPFALWKHSQRLAHELRTQIAHAPPCDHLAVAMTGELADCYATKAEGVKRILEAVEEASDRRHTRVYLSRGVLVSPQVAMTRAREAAAANWHALARFAERLVGDSSALVIDVGSTTCDVVPLVDGKVASVGGTDTQRLLTGELLYTGVERSPVCAVLDRVPYRGQECTVAQELFATTRDVYVVLDELPEGGEPELTADGRPNQKAWARATRAHALRGRRRVQSPRCGRRRQGRGGGPGAKDLRKPSAES